MDGFEHMSAEAGSGQNDSSSTSAANPNGSATDGAFSARAEQWCEAALHHPDDRLACLGAMNSRTAKIVHVQQAAIERSFETCPTPLEAPSIQRGIAACTGLLRQWQSLMSLQERLEKNRLDAEKLEAERQSDPLRRTAH
jgi:hypothetical protein